MKASKSFDETRRKVLHNPKAAAVYLEECIKDGNIELFTAAIKHIADAQSSVTLLPEKTPINQKSLYRTY